MVNPLTNPAGDLVIGDVFIHNNTKYTLTNNIPHTGDDGKKYVYAIVNSEDVFSIKRIKTSDRVMPIYSRKPIYLLKADQSTETDTKGKKIIFLGEIYYETTKEKHLGITQPTSEDVMSEKTSLSKENILEIFKMKGYTYNPVEGILTSPKNVDIKKTCGISHFGEKYSVPSSTLCWYLYYGTAPTAKITYKDGNPENIKIDNLQVIEPKGCIYKPKLKKWEAISKKGGKETSLGFYDTYEEAHSVFMKQY